MILGDAAAEDSFITVHVNLKKKRFQSTVVFFVLLICGDERKSFIIRHVIQDVLEYRIAIIYFIFIESRQYPSMTEAHTVLLRLLSI